MNPNFKKSEKSSHLPAPTSRIFGFSGRLARRRAEQRGSADKPERNIGCHYCALRIRPKKKQSPWKLADYVSAQK